MSKFLSERFKTLKEYVPGEQPQDAGYIKLNTNESPYPPPETVARCVCGDEAAKLRLYPDPDARELRTKLAKYYGLEPENVMVANGSDEILAFVFMAFCDKNRRIAFPDVTYSFYPVYAALFGINAWEIPVNGDFTLDLTGYLDAGRNVIIANPNAPTGIALPRSDIEAIVSSNPDYLVTVDEAYVDFGAQSAAPLLHKYDNLLVIQTFSKSRSMAGARLGYALGPEPVISDLNKISRSFNSYPIARSTMKAGAAAIDDDAYFIEMRRKIAGTRDASASALRGMGFTLTDSKANFLFARHPAKPGGELYRELKERKILVRHFDKPRISDYLRITVGTPDDMAALTTAFEDILGG